MVRFDKEDDGFFRFFKCWFGFVASIIVTIIVFQGVVAYKLLTNVTMDNILTVIKAIQGGN